MKGQTEQAHFLNELQKKSFHYFLDLYNPDNGLIPDTNEKESPASITGVGFALSSYPIAVEKKLFSRAEAAKRTLVTLRFLFNSEQSEKPEATGYKGFYYHFLDMKTGRRTWKSELSFIDTGFLLAGVICAAEYFHKNNPAENEIQKLATAIIDRVDWCWALDNRKALSHGWHPESGFIHYDWEGYSEAILLYCLALGADKLAISNESFEAWSSTYQWENIYDVDFLYAGPFFIHLFSHAWIDFREIRDKFMCEKKIDYFENTRRAIQVQKSYCLQNPKSFIGYQKNCWGITADEGPSNNKQILSGDEIVFFGYSARGVPYGPDDGTIAPWASVASLPFDPDSALDAIKHLRETYPQLQGQYGFKCSFNLSVTPVWCPERFFAMDVGIIIMMIENAQSGLIWNLMKKSSIIQRGLKRAGFNGGWLKGMGR